MRRDPIIKVFSSLIFFAFVCNPTLKLSGQASYPTPKLDASLLPSSPNAQSSLAVGNSLYEGTPNLNLPVYNVKCGSLSLPISLGYSYSGFYPLQDAGWVGMGWHLSAGGVISRIIQGTVDSTRQNGYNYGQYALSDSLLQTNNNNFLQYCYSDDSTYSYDVAPDIFAFSFNGYSGQFYWYKGKAYMLSYNKEIKIEWPSINSNVIITTGDGTAYTFGASESVLMGIHTVGGIRTYLSSWYLSSIISADKKDTISLAYNTTYTWKQYPSPYSNSYVQGTTLATDDLGETSNYPMSPIIRAKVLQSISCRTTQVNFVPTTTARVDIDGTYPSLGEIDVMDAITGTTIRKHTFSYEYFGQTGTYSKMFSRLKLKSLSSVNPLSPTDKQTYSFSYINEYDSGSYPDKGTLDIDYWGYYNHALNTSLFPDSLSFGNADREPNVTYCSYGALDTVFYPTGARTILDYELNDYYASSTQVKKPGPGIRVKKTTQFVSGLDSTVSVKQYLYNDDDGTSSSGTLLHVPSFAGHPYSVDANTYNTFVASNNASGSGVINNVFYYKKVTEQSLDQDQIHRTDYYFNSFSDLYSDVDAAKTVLYNYDAATATFKPLVKTTTDYAVSNDSSFLTITPYVQSAHLNFAGVYVYTYNYTYAYQQTYWKRLANQRTVHYDALNDSMVTSTLYHYNTSRSLDSITKALPDGKTLITRLKYPEDYVTSLTGNMITNHVISPIVEKQSWLQNGSSPLKLVSGEVTQFDQSIFKPVSVYNIQITAPLTTLNNETLSSGKYNTFLADASYQLTDTYYYDTYSNLNQYSKPSNIPVSYVYGYNHSFPIAEVKNANANQIAFTSFEFDGLGNWSVASTVRDTVNSITGTRSYNLSNGSVSISSLTASTVYIVSYWSRNGSYSVTGSTGVTIGNSVNGWIYCQHIVTNTTSVTISGSGNIDELRLYPSTAQMQSYTYLPLIGVSSNNDASNIITYYEYDGFGRALSLRDANKNILKLYEYAYSQPYTFYNDTVSASFQRNNCPCGQYGSSVPDTIAAGLYISHSSKIDANQRALSALNVAGQSNANSHGTCSNIVCVGPGRKIVNCLCETGYKIYTSSVWSPTQHRWVCTYHYEWSDGSWSQDNTELSITQCATN